MRDIANVMLLITRQQIYHKHGVSKNNTDVAYYNCDAHFDMFWHSHCMPRQHVIKWRFIFPAHLTYVSALRRKHENRSFQMLC